MSRDGAAYMRDWRRRNKAKVLAINKRCYKKHHERRKAEMRARYAANKETIRAKDRVRYLVRVYGISGDDYEKLLAAQDGRCAICRRLPIKNRLSVDHDHGANIIRGLLCARCNRGIGIFWDDPEMLMAAARYLELK